MSEPTGTFVCRYCGMDTPHYHSPEYVRQMDKKISAMNAFGAWMPVFTMGIHASAVCMRGPLSPSRARDYRESEYPDNSARGDHSTYRTAGFEACWAIWWAAWWGASLDTGGEPK